MKAKNLDDFMSTTIPLLIILWKKIAKRSREIFLKQNCKFFATIS
jgi:hypothetical protein